MLFLVDARVVPGADIARHLAEEKREVETLLRQGLIEQLVRRLDEAGAWLIVNADTAASAKQRLDELPFVRAGIMTMHLSSVERL